MSIIAVPPPASPIYRVARKPYPPFEPRPWPAPKDARPDGTFGNRFDDPSGLWGVPEKDRFRAIYCAAQPAGAFGETIARFQVSLTLIADIGNVIEDEETEDDLIGYIDDGWLKSVWLVHAQLDPSLRFADIEAAETIQTLRHAPAVARKAAELGFNTVDLSNIIGPQRLLTQTTARYIYEQVDDSGNPLFAGVRYISRLNEEWECWALFDTRVRYSAVITEEIQADNPDLLNAGALLRVSLPPVK